MDYLHPVEPVVDVITVDEIVPFLTRERKIDFENFTKEKLSDCLPPGWHCFNDEIFHAINLFKVKVGKLEINQGFLHIKSTSENELDDLLFKRYADNLKYNCTKVCMMCGAYGWRRVDITFKPIFCTRHYREFINIEEYYV